MKHWAYCRSNHGTESSVEREGGGQILHGQPNFNPSRCRASLVARSTNDWNSFLLHWWNWPCHRDLVEHTVTLLSELLHDSRM